MQRTFTRAELYELVWSRPRTLLAKEFGISDVAIRKHCLQADIPVPSVGFWAKLNAGGKAVREPLPLRLPGRRDTIAFGEDRDHWPKSTNLPEKPSFVEDLEAQVTVASKRIGRIRAARDLTNPDPSLSYVLRSEEKRRVKFAVDQWSWYKPRFDAPVIQRQLRIFNSLAKALNPLYGAQSVREKEEWVQGQGTLHHLVLYLDFGGCRMSLRFYEPGEVHKNRGSRKITRTTLRVEDSRPEARVLEWTDEEGKKIEGQLSDILSALMRHAEQSLREHAEWVYEESLKRYHQELAAMERQKEQAERERLAAIEVSKAKFRDAVVAIAQSKRTAEDIRATVAALRAHPEMATGDSKTAFEDWANKALAVADSLDPMSWPLSSIVSKP